MSGALLLSVHLHDGRWHGIGDWPPSPMRLFQALVAGVGVAGVLAQHRDALAWLEALDAPMIAAPLSMETRGFTNFVPNNDLDAVGGDPGRVGEIRAGKSIKPRLFETAATFLFAWTYEVNDDAETAALAARVRDQAVARLLRELPSDRAMVERVLIGRGATERVVAALRRALMSRAADADGRIPTLFSGHEEGPEPARSGDHRHVYLVADDEDGDGLLDRLAVIAPWSVDHTWTPTRSEQERFEQVVRGLDVLRAGIAGLLSL